MDASNFCSQEIILGNFYSLRAKKENASPEKNSKNAIEIQREIAVMIEDTLLKVKRLIYSYLKLIHQIPLKDFIKNHVVSNAQEISLLDNRTHRFFLKMSEAIEREIDESERENPCLNPVMNYFSKQIEMPELRQKLIQNLAFPSVMELIRSLNKIKPTLIDDLGSKE